MDEYPTLKVPSLGYKYMYVLMEQPILSKTMFIIHFKVIHLFCIYPCTDHGENAYHGLQDDKLDVEMKSFFVSKYNINIKLVTFNINTSWYKHILNVVKWYVNVIRNYLQFN